MRCQCVRAEVGVRETYLEFLPAEIRLETVRVQNGSIGSAP
jgi:hypothetical protein